MGSREATTAGGRVGPAAEEVALLQRPIASPERPGAEDHPAECRHVHREDEWAPVQCNGESWYPTGEEAEYTAELAFQLAIALSMWAVRVRGFPLQVPKPLKPEPAGSRLCWPCLLYTSPSPRDRG